MTNPQLNVLMIALTNIANAMILVAKAVSASTGRESHELNEVNRHAAVYFIAPKIKEAK